MAARLIERHDEWSSLIAELVTRGGWSWLRDIPLREACAVLAAPAAIARWIAVCAPAIAMKPAISLLVIGAEAVDAPDQGRWYQVLPQLLDAACAIEVTLLGSELDSGLTSGAATHAPQPAARCVRKTLGEFFAPRESLHIDLAVVFHPGLQKHQGWLGGAGFARLLRAGVPLIASSYAVDEYEMERWVLECFGYRASAEPLLNPFFLELGDERSSIRWGRALWRFESAPPSANVVDKKRLARLDSLTSMVMHSITCAEPPSPGYGAPAELRTGAGVPRKLIHVFDNRYVDTTSGEILHLTPSGQMKTWGYVPVDELACYPGEAGRDIERAIWGAEVKSRYLLASYARQAPPDASSATARDMLAAMREKAASFFRK